MNYDFFKSYSSYGEDAIFAGVLKRLSWIMQDNLFDYNTYIDIGSFHPVKESNTYFLNQLGWGGTLIDPNSYFNALVHELRPHDILYNYAVDSESGTREFHMFGDMDSSNSLSKDFVNRKISSQHTNVGWTKQVQAKTINEIVDMHTYHFERVPFFINLDIEGVDLDVIKTYDKADKTPFIMIEDDSNEIFGSSEIKSVMIDKGYVPISTTFLTTLYLDVESRFYPNLKKIGMFE